MELQEPHRYPSSEAGFRALVLQRFGEAPETDAVRIEMRGDEARAERSASGWRGRCVGYGERP